MPIKFTVLGGGKEIGANCYLLEWQDKKFLLDCGKHPERKDFSSLPKFDLIGNKLNAVFISHTHNDHVGSLPALIRKFPDVPVYITEPAFDMLEVVIRDTLKLVTKKSHFEGLYYYEQLFKDENLMKRMLANFNKVEYDKEYDSDGIKFKFLDAGHLLGSAMINIYDDGCSVLYTGDVRTSKFITTKGVEQKGFDKTDVLIMEGTYGLNVNRQGIDLKTAENAFVKTIKKTLTAGGKVLIPAFAQGKTQDLLVYLETLCEQKQIPDAPIESFGLGNKINRKYLDNLQCLSDSYNINLLKKHTNGMNASNLDVVINVDKPMIIVATSGMLDEGTYSYTIAKDLLQDEKNTIIFTGYLGRDTLAKELLDKGQGGKITLDDGALVDINCGIERYSFSGHSNQLELVQFADAVKPKTIFLVHGDAQALEKLKNLIKVCPVKIPGNSESHKIEMSGQKLIASSAREKRALLVTVGTSLITNFNIKKNLSRAFNPQKDELKEFLFNEENSAEVSTLNLVQDKNPDNDIIYLVISDTKEAKLCAELLAEYFKCLGFETVPVIVKGLVYNYNDFMKLGLPEFVNKMVEIIGAHNANAVIIATGGFKAETAYATLIGFVCNCPVKYLYDDMKNIVDFPPVGLTFDYEKYELYAETISRLLMSKNLAEAGNYFKILPAYFQKLFYKDKVLQQYRPAPLGNLIIDSYNIWKRKSLEKQKEVKVRSKKETVWVKKIDNIDAIPDREVKNLLKGIIAKNVEIIKSIEFLSSIKGAVSGRIMLEFEELGHGFVKYMIKTPDGKQPVKFITYPMFEKELKDRIK